MIPTVGRIVHYRRHDKTLAAIITEVSRPIEPPTQDGYEEDDYIVSLCVLSSNGSFFKVGVSYSSEPEHKHWSWPPRVS